MKKFRAPGPLSPPIALVLNFIDDCSAAMSPKVKSLIENFAPLTGAPSQGVPGGEAKFISETICREVVIKVNKANKVDKRFTRRKKKVKTWVVHIF